MIYHAATDPDLWPDFLKGYWDVNRPEFPGGRFLERMGLWEEPAVIHQRFEKSCLPGQP
jgi:hypothetical protein